MPYGIWKEYRRWLFQLVDSKGKYTQLLDMLFHREFTYLMERDENRAVDGQYLVRHLFEKDTDLAFDVEQVDEIPCSVLEMLVALAIRMDNEFLGDPNHPDPKKWFWEMVNNLRLDLKHGGSIVNQGKIDIWLNRSFHPSGFGSIFPLKRPTRDQRNLEIWDQMNAYIFENYD